jgi:EPS-associated MarR family transcriptional regulator
MKTGGTSLEAKDALRLRVLRAVEADPGLSQRQLANNLGVSLGATNYALRALVGQGLVKADRFARADRKAGYLYVLTPSGLSAKARLARAFLARKRKEHAALRREIELLSREAQQAGGEIEKVADAAGVEEDAR